MGVDYTARAVIGVRLPLDDDLPRAKKMVRKKAFEHNYKDGGDNEFDPKTGKKLFLDEKEEVEEDFPAFVFDDDNGEDGEIQKVIKAPKGMAITCGTDGNCRCLGYVVRTGSSNGGDDYGFGRIPDLNEIKNEIKALLEPIDLWDEEDFGLHVILYCSY